MNTIQWILNRVFSVMAHKYTKQFKVDTKHAGKVNRQILAEILELNKHSEYGGLYHFADIKGSTEYKKVVPLTDYADYEKYIDRIAAGEQNVLTTEPVKYFALSSGTTGKQKYIPITERHRKVINLHMTFMRQGLINQSIPAAKTGGRGLLLINMAKPSGVTAGGLPTGAGTSEGIKAMQRILPYIWTSPIKVLELSNQQTANYLHLLFALKERNLAYIVAPFPSAILQLFNVLEENWPRLVQDIARGTIGGHLQLDPQVKALLEKKLKPDPTRASELEIELAQGMMGIAGRIWPKLHYISCVIGGSFSIYTDKLRYFIGQLPIDSSVYGATEALIALTVKPNNVTYVITPRTAYFEFLPVNKAVGPNPTTLDLDQLKVGESYEVVVTNFAGFYRYRLGDIIKVVGYYQQSPVIEFLYRKGQLLNLAAEKTSELAVQHALTTAAEKWGTDVIDYTVRLDLDAAVGCYRFYVEVGRPDVLLDRIEKNRDILEQALAEANPRFLAGLKAKRIAPLALHVVKPGTFHLMRQLLMKKGASFNQVKIPRVIKDEQLIHFLEQNHL